MSSICFKVIAGLRTYCQVALNVWFVFFFILEEEAHESAEIHHCCSACWHRHGFFAEEVGAYLGTKEDNLKAVRCHFMKTDFSHETGQTVDNSSGILSKLTSLYHSSELSDITICVGKQQFDVHRLILCSASEVFRIMLLSQSWSDYTKKTIQLEEEESCAALFEPFLQFLYSGRIHLDHKSVLPVLMLADKYIV